MIGSEFGTSADHKLFKALNKVLHRSRVRRKGYASGHQLRWDIALHRAPSSHAGYPYDPGFTREVIRRKTRDSSRR